MPDRRLDYLAVTHADPDHIGGAPAIVRDFHPREIWEGVPVPRSRALAELQRLARAQRIAWRTLQTGDVVVVDDVAIRVLHPPPPDWERQRVRNDDSLVLELRYGDVSLVLPGDIGADVETGLARRLQAAAVRVLKAPHHGSRTSSSEAFIAAVRPSVAIVSAGRENRFGHPHPDVVRRYADAGARLLRTADVGAVTACTDGRRVAVTTARGDVLTLGGP